MPRKSERGKVLEELEQLRQAVLLQLPGERRNKMFNDLMHLEIQVCSFRYIERPVVYSKGWKDSQFLAWISDQQIMVHCHMCRPAFDYVLWLVRDFDCWENRLSVRKPRCIMFQLFIALARLASGDSGSTMQKLVVLLKVSYGSMIDYAERFIRAILQHEKRFIKWPGPIRREQLANYGETEHGFHGFIGSMDGTHFYFKRAPHFSMFPEAYNDTWHKGGYAYNCLLTADHTGSVIAYLIGWPGGQCDKVLQPSTALHADPWKFLKKGEQFLFVDGGFARTMYAVPPYVGKAGKLPHNREFNYSQRQARCRIEHVNAILKGRLGSLRAIPIEIACAEDHFRAQQWIKACLVLHNIFVRLKDQWVFEDSDSESDSDSDSDSGSEGSADDDGGADCSGLVFQNAIRDRFLRSRGWIDAQ
jgi:hypothetical protein